jgi:probable rRNA maturation factor
MLPEGWEGALSAVLKNGLACADAPEDCEISLSFVTSKEMRELNNMYRMTDSETDVLSFAFNEGEPLPDGQSPAGDTENKPPDALGDIVICLNAARNQAEEYGHSYLRELAFLTAHGLLHLLGYDHETPEGEREMIKAQDEILNKAGIGRD